MMSVHMRKKTANCSCVLYEEEWNSSDFRFCFRFFFLEPELELLLSGGRLRHQRSSDDEKSVMMPLEFPSFVVFLVCFASFL